jgi:hypothetical protein
MIKTRWIAALPPSIPLGLAALREGLSPRCASGALEADLPP